MFFYVLSLFFYNVTKLSDYSRITTGSYSSHFSVKITKCLVTVPSYVIYKIKLLD